MVLPEPVSPTTATTDSAGMVKETSRSTGGPVRYENPIPSSSTSKGLPAAPPLEGSTTSTGTSSTRRTFHQPARRSGSDRAPPQLGDRLEQQVDEEQEGDELTDLQAEIVAVPDTDPHGDGQRDRRHDIDDGEHAGEPDLAALLLGELTLDRVVETLTNRFAVAVRPDDLGTVTASET